MRRYPHPYIHVTLTQSWQSCACIKFLTHHTDVLINGEDSLICSRFMEFWRHQLLHAQHNSVLATNSYGSTAYIGQQTMWRPRTSHHEISSSFQLNTYLLFSTAFMAYSIWNTRPSGENWAAERSYWGTKEKVHVRPKLLHQRDVP